MRIAVFGAGSLGSAVGGLLSTKHEVTLVGREAHVREVQRAGLRISGTVMGHFWPRAATDVHELDVQDLVLITVKAYSTREAAREIVPLVGAATLVVSLQNGLNNGEVLDHAFGSRAVVGVPVLGANYLGPGEVRMSGLQEVVLGSLSGHLGAAIRTGEVLSECSIPTRISAAIRSEVWMKVLVNASVNPVTALVRHENGHLLRHKELISLCRSLCLEGASAAEANGIDLGGVDPFERAMEVVRATSGNRSSMLQDVERGRWTEIDQINGALVLSGESKGVSMPVNKALWQLVRSLR
jgi:2-dehydropantoate 2-reductase